MRSDRSGFRGVDVSRLYVDELRGLHVDDDCSFTDAPDADVYALLDEEIPRLEVADYLDGSPLPKDYAGVLRFARNLGQNANRFALAWLAYQWRSFSLTARPEWHSPELRRVDIMMHSAGLMLGCTGFGVRDGFELSDAAGYALSAMRAGFEPDIVVDVLVRHGGTVEGFFNDGSINVNGANALDKAHLVAMARRLQAEHLRRAEDYRRAAFLELRGGDLLARVFPGNTVWGFYSRALEDVGLLQSSGNSAPALHAAIEQRLGVGGILLGNGPAIPVVPLLPYQPMPTPPPPVI